MMISTKGRYALRFLVDVAEHQGDGFVPLKDVAVRQEISEKYLEIVVKELVKGGLLSAMRGKGGGYRLNRPPEEYNVRSILELMEGPWPPSSAWSRGRTPAPGARTAGRFPCGRDWTRSSRIIWRNLPWRIYMGKRKRAYMPRLCLSPGRGQRLGPTGPLVKGPKKVRGNCAISRKRSPGNFFP